MQNNFLYAKHSGHKLAHTAIVLFKPQTYRVSKLTNEANVCRLSVIRFTVPQLIRGSEGELYLSSLMLCTLPLDLISFHTWLHLISSPFLYSKENERETKKKQNREEMWWNKTKIINVW